MRLAGAKFGLLAATAAKEEKWAKAVQVQRAEQENPAARIREGSPQAIPVRAEIGQVPLATSLAATGATHRQRSSGY
jgi:hypothetical protein